MKRCPKCSEVYADELLFCLADGTPLKASEDGEQPTVVRPATRIPVEVPPERYTTARDAATPTVAVPQKSGGVLKFVALGVGLLLLLVIIGGAAAAFLLWPRGEVATVTNTANNTVTNTANGKVAANSWPTPNTATNNSNSIAADREDELDRERKKLADERKKLEDEKRRKETENNTAGDDPPAPPTFNDPGPARLSFRRGSTGTTVSGTIGRARSYMLRAMAGQYLNASVRSSGGCVVFSSGGASTQFSTGAGDTYLYLKNTCTSPSTFSMSVNVR